MRWAVRLTKPVLMLVAFTLSMVLYLYVQSQTTPRGAAEVDLVVHSKHQDGLIFDEEGGTVKYGVAGPRDKIDRLVTRLAGDPTLVTALADLGSISPNNVHGEYTIPKVRLVVQRPSEFDDVTFTQLDRFTGVVERPKTREVKIRVDFASPPSKDAWADYDRDSFEVSPPTVTLTGPASDVTDASLTVVVNPKEAQQTGLVRVPLSIPHNLTGNPRVDVVDVRPTRRERQAYVNVTFAGRLAPGYRISNYYVVTNALPSSTVPIRGPSGIVDKTSSIDATVDISGLTKGFTFTAAPKMPRQLELVEPPLRIRVDVEKTHR